MLQKKGNFPGKAHVRFRVDERFVSVQKRSDSLEGLQNAEAIELSTGIL